MEFTVNANDMELMCRHRGDGVVISRVRTEARSIVVPEEIDGRPVTALGPKAFAPHAGEDGPDHKCIRSITLPETVERVGDYAFYNCSGLERLRLTDRTRFWGGSCLMNCRSFRQIELTVTDEGSPTLWHFADELMGELDVLLTYGNGETARLIFPEYTEAFEDNRTSLFFDFHIYGPGLPYHHAFQHKRLDYGLFDGCWEEFLRRDYELRCAVRLAFFRLYHPARLNPRAEEKYCAFLAENSGETLRWLLEERDSRALDWFLKRFAPEQAALGEALELARQSRQPEAAALLLSRQHAAAPKGRSKTFDL